MKTIPEKLIDCSVYKDGTLPLGIASVDLPSLEVMTETIKGAGILGEVESPTPGHYGAMTSTLNFRTITREAIRLLDPVNHTLDFRGSQQVYDVSKGQQVYQGVRVTVKGFCKVFGLGKLEAQTTTDTTVEVTVNYIKIVIDDEVVFELDKFNAKHVTNGTDHYALIRKQLGL